MNIFTERQVVNFFRKFDKVESGCWEWKASIHKSGYGQYGVVTLPSGGLAHRFSYIYHYGEIPDGLFVCHKCDNRKCVNPDHLFLGTNKENMDDRKNKGLGRVVGEKGELHCGAKLTEALVKYARDEYRRGRTGKSLAEELNMSLSTITRAIRGETWGHVPGAVTGDLFETGDRHRRSHGTL